MTGKYLGGRKGPKEKRTLKGTAEARALIMAQVAHLPEVPSYERMGEEAAESVFAYISCGGSLRAWCEKADLPYATVHDWIRKHAPERYTQAREAGAEALADRILEISSTPMPMTERIVTTDADGRVTETVKTADNVQARKLAVWGTLELMKSWSPERYGKRVTVEAGGRMAEAIAAARSRVGELEGRRLKPPAAEVIDVPAKESTTRTTDRRARPPAVLKAHEASEKDEEADDILDGALF